MTDLEPLDDDVLALLREAKPIPAVDRTTSNAIYSTVEARIEAPPTPGGGGPGGTSAVAGKALVLAATFALGVGTGIAIAPAAKTSPVTPVASAIVRVATPAVSEGPLIEYVDSPATRPSVTSARPRTEPPVPSARGLAAERRLLDIARAALARGDASAALDAVERHGREYTEGVLVEEREALAVKSLVALGRNDEARARAERFEKRFPNGLMLRAVKAAVSDQ